MAHQGQSGIGMKKHKRSGYKNGAGKSPKLRHSIKREAEQDERKSKPPLPYRSVKEALDSAR